MVDRDRVDAAAVRGHVSIPADLERLAELRAAVREVAERWDAPPDCTGDLVQAIDEAATNIIRYGYRGEPGEIEMTADLHGDDIVITLADRAPAFDPVMVPPPDLSVPPLHRKPGGMGVHLMRLSTDSMEHRARPGGGNILTL
ncbi:MAG TPA: ATP-binding protein, partial [Candidatus Limnocylindrales bacterium]|nr:ATP-binding protein [Candidatus Limnocylindrales bacterium]